ncbi:RRQRL motif-containing zinc-binding protein [Sphaerisporangium perillae]|uniref:RRQRL motif-containing zinc-binding protein n=1 Tax=Sphaerisporangium perillae TaxID=2935860 RepID=UPI00200E54CC|nr:RRQRL motif-containing zinc-binding protein [Sphaerisporangium perillae]
MSGRIYWDPTGAEFGIPTYPYRMAPKGLATRRQLTALGLRPAGQDVQAQILWRRGKRVAYLYAVELAKPKRTPTAAQLAALERAMQARRTCPRCLRDIGYCLRKRWPACLDCQTPDEREAA